MGGGGGRTVSNRVQKEGYTEEDDKRISGRVGLVQRLRPGEPKESHDSLFCVVF